MKHQVRDYQQFAVDSIFKYFQSGKRGNPIVAMPTATGKSHVIAAFIEQVLKKYPDQRIMMITHVKELIEQNFDKIKDLWPEAPVGIYSAGVGRRDLYHPVIYAGIASIIRVIDRVGHIDLVLVDECHLISPEESTMYHRTLSALMKFNPNLKVVGFTATPYRTSTGDLVDDDNGIFTHICADLTTPEAFKWFLKEGYLSPVIPRATNTEIDVSNIGTVAGDYNKKELEAATDQRVITEAAVDEMIKLGAQREHWLLFGTSLNHCASIRDALADRNISAVVVHSKMSKTERTTNTRLFTSGQVRALVNMGVFTTGFDYPLIDMIAILRATQSTSLWVQMVGRGLRTVYAPGFDLSTTQGRLDAISAGPKQDCLVLDFAGNTRRLGPIDNPIRPSRGKKGGTGAGTAPVKVCPVCMVYNPINVRFCTNCGEEFPVAVKIEEQASTMQLISGEKESEVPEVHDFPVTHISYSIHNKVGRPPSLQVTYTCGLRQFKEWICFEHETPIRNKAHAWWKRREGGNPPLTTQEGLERISELKQPSAIKVWVNKKYPEIINYVFE